MHLLCCHIPQRYSQKIYQSSLGRKFHRRQATYPEGGRQLMRRQCSRVHPGLAAQAADDGGVDGGHRAVHVGVIDGGNCVALRARHQVLLDRSYRTHVFYIAILARLQRHVLGTHLRTAGTSLNGMRGMPLTSMAVHMLTSASTGDCESTSNN